MKHTEIGLTIIGPERKVVLKLATAARRAIRREIMAFGRTADAKRTNTLTIERHGAITDGPAHGDMKGEQIVACLQDQRATLYTSYKYADGLVRDPDVLVQMEALDQAIKIVRRHTDL